MKAKARGKALMTIETIEGQPAKRAPRPTREQARAERENLIRLGLISKARPQQSA